MFSIVIFIFNILIYALNIYQYMIIAYCLLSFIPIRTSNEFVYKIIYILHKTVRPAFELVQMLIPRRFLVIGMVDLSPILIFLGIYFIKIGLYYLVKIILI